MAEISKIIDAIFDNKSLVESVREDENSSSSYGPTRISYGFTFKKLKMEIGYLSWYNENTDTFNSHYFVRAFAPKNTSEYVHYTTDDLLLSGAKPKVEALFAYLKEKSTGIADQYKSILEGI
jgi:hypothetical protein